MKKITNFTKNEVLEKYGDLLKRMVIRVDGQKEVEVALALFYNLSLEVEHDGKDLVRASQMSGYKLKSYEYGYIVYDTIKEKFVWILENQDAKYVVNDELGINKLKGVTVESRLKSKAVKLLTLFKTVYSSVNDDTIVFGVNITKWLFDFSTDDMLIDFAHNIFYGIMPEYPNGIDTFDEPEEKEEGKPEFVNDTASPQVIEQEEGESEEQEEEQEEKELELECSDYAIPDDFWDDEEWDTEKYPLYENYIDAAAEYIWRCYRMYKYSIVGEYLMFNEWLSEKQGTRAFKRFVDLGLLDAVRVYDLIVDTYFS